MKPTEANQNQGNVPVNKKLPKTSTMSKVQSFIEKNARADSNEKAKHQGTHTKAKFA